MGVKFQGFLAEHAHYLPSVQDIFDTAKCGPPDFAHVVKALI